MDHTSPQWPLVVKEGINGGAVNKNMQVSNNNKPDMIAERTSRPQKQQALSCPRCNSTHTKFCYYNNYSLSQPRYFCKTCKRYWTEGGSLRNVPVGGGSRKSRRPSTTSSPPPSSSSSSKKKNNNNRVLDLIPPNFPHLQNLIKIHESQDLNQAYLPTSLNYNNSSSSSSLFQNSIGSELLKNIHGSSSLASFISSLPLQDSNPTYSSSSGMNFQELLKPSDGGSTNYGGGVLQGIQQTATADSGAKLSFPFENYLKRGSELFEQNTNGQGDHESDHQGYYWNEMFGRGGGGGSCV